MSLYSVLMVDDEQEVIEVITRKLNWKNLALRSAGPPGTGQKH